MSTLISSPFFFDNTTVRDACVDALGLSGITGLIPSGDSIITVTESTVLSSVHVGKTVLVNSTSPTTITVPTDSSSGFNSFIQITVININTGTVTIAASSGVAINTTETLILRKRYSGVLLSRSDSNNWILTGDTVPAQPYYITKIDIPNINSAWSYNEVEGIGISNISYRGVTPTIGVSSPLTAVFGANTLSLTGRPLTIPILYGMNFECSFDGIEILHLNSNPSTGFYIGNLLTDTTGNITIEMGVSPFPIGEEKWLMAGIRLTRVSGSWSCVLIKNGETSGTAVTSVAITGTDDFIEVDHNISAASTLRLRCKKTNAAVETKTVLMQTFNAPLYSRIWISGPKTAQTSFYVSLHNTVTNGKGANIPVRFESLGGNKVEVLANVI